MLLVRLRAVIGLVSWSIFRDSESNKRNVSHKHKKQRKNKLSVGKKYINLGSALIISSGIAVAVENIREYLNFLFYCVNFSETL